MKDREPGPIPELPPEIAPLFARERQRQAEQNRVVARLRRRIAECEDEIKNLRRAIEDSELRRVAEVGAIRHDMEGEREKNAALREKLVRAENAKRAAARDVLDARLAGTTQESDRKALEVELADTRAEIERLRAEIASTQSRKV